MPPDTVTVAEYFDTPARAERLQLLLHLIRNADEVVFLRAPVGAGKTRFAHRLLDILGGDLATAWVRAGADRDIVEAVMDQLGVDEVELVQWPEAVLDNLTGHELLVVVDDADRLDIAAIERLASLRAAGGHVLLLGTADKALPAADWELRFVDLPAFEPAQSARFLRRMAGPGEPELGDDLVAALHSTAQGLPGPLLDGLADLRQQGTRGAAPAELVGARMQVLPWVIGAVTVVVLLSILVLQDQINPLFEPSSTERASEQVAEVPGAATGRREKIVEWHADAPVAAQPVQPTTLSAAPPVVALPELPRPPLPELVEPRPAADAAVADAQPPADALEAVVQDALAAETAVGTAVATAAVRPPEVTPPPTTDGDVPAAVTGTETAPPAAGPELAAPIAEAPVEELVTSAATPIPPPPPKVVVAPRPTVVAPRPTADAPPAKVVASGGQAWLKSRPPTHYTLQLVGAHDRASVEKFIADHNVAQPYAIFQRQLNGRPWYSLVAGDYPDRDAAVAARAKLPKGLVRGGVWPRTFESIAANL